MHQSAGHCPPLSYRKSVKKYALHAACWNNAPISVIQALLKAWPGAVRALADNNHCPLHEACIHPKCLSTIQLLVKAWPDSVQQRTSVYGFLPIQFALMSSEPVSLDIVRFLVKQWPKSLKVKSNWDSIAVQYALQYQQSDDIIRYLVQQCPDSLDCRDRFLESPLHVACYHQASLPVIQCLVQHWPKSVKHRNEHDAIPFHYAATRSSPDYVSVLRFLAQQWPEAVQSKSMGGAIGGLPLMRALGNRNVPMEIIAYLIELWPDPMKEVHDGQMMLCHAVHYHYRNNDVISLVIDQWPKAICIPNSDGNLLLMVALTLEEEEEKPSVELIPILTNGMPPLHFICQYSNSWTTQ